MWMYCSICRVTKQCACRRWEKLEFREEAAKKMVGESGIWEIAPHFVSHNDKLDRANPQANLSVAVFVKLQGKYRSCR